MSMGLPWASVFLEGPVAGYDVSRNSANEQSNAGSQDPRRWLALVHESEPARNDPNPQAPHLPTAYDAGLPR
jgi:hypothetical protein